MLVFLRGMYFFHLFYSFFLKILFSTNKTFKFPNGIYASGKGSTKLAYTSDQSSIWAMPCGPLLLEIRKVSPKPYCILMTAFTLSVICQTYKETEKIIPKK